MLKSAAQYIAQHYETWEHLAYSYLMGFMPWVLGANLGIYGFDTARKRVFSTNEYLNNPNSPLKNTSLAQLRQSLSV